MSFKPTQLLYIDGLAAAGAGAFILLLREWLSGWLGLPLWLVTAQGAANWLYAAYSLSLARSSHRPPWRVGILIAGNLSYALLAAFLLWYYYPVCTVWGVAYFLLEVVVIGGLGLLEWRYRKILQTEPLSEADSGI